MLKANYGKIIFTFLDYGLMDTIENKKHRYDNMEKKDIQDKGDLTNIKQIETDIVQKTCKENEKTLNNYVSVEPVVANRIQNSKRKKNSIFDKIKRGKFMST